MTIHRWVQRFIPLLIDAARPCRHLAGDRWFVDETYVKVAGVWRYVYRRYVYRAVDQHGQVINVYVSSRRDIAAARVFFTVALAAQLKPAEVVTNRAPALAHVIDDLTAYHRRIAILRDPRCDNATAPSASEHDAALSTLVQMVGHSTSAAAHDFRHTTLPHARWDRSVPRVRAIERCD